MSIPDIADLITIAARVLEIDASEALDLIDVPAAETALGEARNRRGEPAGQVAAALLTGLIRHPPLPRGNRQVALLAMLQFLGRQGLGLDLQPATAARDLIAGITTGTLAEPAVTAWISGRLRPQQGKEAGIMKRLTRRGNCEALAVTARAGKFPHLTDRAYRAVTMAEAEAAGLRHNYVGTEHLLLGLVREGAGVAAQILGRLGADRAAIVEAILHVLSGADPTCREQRRALLTGELTAVLDENDRLHAEIERLRLLLRQHGIEPGDCATRSA